MLPQAAMSNTRVGSKTVQWWNIRIMIVVNFTLCDFMTNIYIYIFYTNIFFDRMDKLKTR